MSAPGLWHLGARTGQLSGGVDGWRTLAHAAATLSQRLRAATDPLAASWRGASTEAYYQHRARALGLADTVSTVAGAIAATVEAAVAALSFGQTHLDDSWLRLTRAVPGLRGFGFPVFGSPVEVLALSVAVGAAGDAVRAAIAEAHDIRDHVDGRLTGYAAEGPAAAAAGGADAGALGVRDAVAAPGRARHARRHPHRRQPGHRERHRRK